MTVSTYGYRIAKEDLKAKVIRGAGNTVLKTQWNWTLDDLDSDAAVQLLGCMSLYFSEVPWIAKYCSTRPHGLYSKRKLLYRSISIDNFCFREIDGKIIYKRVDFDTHVIVQSGPEPTSYSLR